MTRFANLVCISFAIIGSTYLAIQNQEQDKQDPQDKDRIVIPADDDKSVERRDFMRIKLLATQNIFEGLTTGKLSQIEEGINEVKGITEGERWVAIDNDYYRKLTDDFVTTTKRLTEAAESKNLDAIALRFYQMSTSCIDCHKHVRDAAYEF